MTTQIAIHLSRLALQILLLPLLALLIPLIFAMAWVHEAIGDLAARSQGTLAAPVPVRVRCGDERLR